VRPLTEEKKKGPKSKGEIEWKSDKSQIMHLKEGYEKLKKEKEK
jgi:hypothetical protein